MSNPQPLLYGLLDRPPAVKLLLLAFQHICLMASPLVLPAVLVAEIGGSRAEAQTVVALSMIACGFGTILQATRLPGIGSGYFVPNVVGPNFFAASMSAAWIGGLPLMRGMTIFAGLFQVLFSSIIRRVKFLFPNEILGLVVMMVGVGLVPVSSSKLMSIEFASDAANRPATAIAIAVLLLMMVLTVRGAGVFRLFAVLIGMIGGYVLCLATGMFSAGDLDLIASLPWLRVPDVTSLGGFDFSVDLIPTFIIVSICGTLKSFGNLVLAEKVNNPEWTEPNMSDMQRGLIADGVALASSGVIGGMASDTSSSNVALSGTSGATSRVIAYATGAIFILLGFFPKISTLLAVMPAPVAGAVLVFSACYMIMSGLQIITSEKLDYRRTFSIGIGLFAGFSHDIVPQVYANVPSFMHPIMGSSLSFAVIVAVALNQLLGVRLSTKPRGGAPS
jgi:NCS2 family nucleobase:cation symporter-2